MLAGSKLLEIIAAATAVTSEAEMLATMKAVARELNCEHVVFGIQLRLHGTAPVHHVTSGYPDAYQVLYQQRGYIGTDPTVAHCQQSPEPIFWSEKMYREYKKESLEVMEESRHFGLGEGVSLSVHPNSSIVSMLSLARDKPFESAAERAELVAAGNVLAHCIHVASERLILPNVMAQRQPHLSPREMQCLQQLAAGKSSKEIADALRISDETVITHIKRILTKFGVASRVHAVAIAMTLGML